MPPTRILRRASPLTPLFTALNVVFLMEMYRVVNGTHPFVSPRLEAMGISLGAQASSSAHADTRRTGERTVEKRLAEAPRIETTEVEGDMGFTMLNGVPIPRFEMLIRPFR